MPNTALVEELATTLIRAEDERQNLTSLADQHPELDEELGYAVQDRTLQLREARGEQLVGIKLGLTSKAKQQRMNVDTPIVGWLTNVHRITDAQLAANDGRIPEDLFIHPRVEPEIFVTLKHDLEGADVTTEDVRAAIDKVYAGLDVIDSRYQDFRFTLGDVVADNASGAGFVLGPIGLNVDDLDLALEAVVVEVDGEVVDTATGAAILGHPLNAIAEGVRLLARRGRKLEAGQIVLAGAMTDAVATNVGRSITFHFTNLGSIRLRGTGE
ncbi:2-keto-4-pentenoate hydratase [Gulosibacter chungangensis]|uniref:4-oxalocrotonate decarboxylase n=1 Tax=Gulosibacter chungangensis TaxID=979746 RepID=A0A7J5BCG9_9MICO|nr:fumarylacetoacetate hydrolase family protein [Gulosibacter chungangensis]KAB1643657.1 4-oxalocrotonate decarboxylase [Gulosibacter chungangensis]